YCCHPACGKNFDC
uniref:Alpha-conotoxin SIA n=2 Tax=Conus striatus TaxID=6493 RepID=CA1A_CONST|nr:RecName: Full=Alpha-conotoxin SIA; AltName: Full=S1A [Conus striatus]AAB19853.1 alpha-conotoxin SIA [Conus striatus=marine molluscs, Peptide Partial, 13 aa] [Conus striatus]